MSVIIVVMFIVIVIVTVNIAVSLFTAIFDCYLFISLTKIGKMLPSLPVSI